MRSWFKIVIAVVVLGVLAGAAFSEFVLDIRTTHSTLRKLHSVQSSFGYLMADLEKNSKDMQKTYGPKAGAAIGPGGALETRVDGKKVRTEYVKGTFGTANGFIGVAVTDTDVAIFPFDLGPNNDPRASRNSLTDMIKARWKNRPAAQSYLNFTMQDWDDGDCVKPKVGEIGLGPLGEPLSFLNGVACVVIWKRNHPSSMMIGVNVAENNPFLRLFVPWLCRRLTMAALDKLVSAGAQVPDYAACVFVDRYFAGQTKLSVDVFEVKPGRRLARIGKVS
jgi:hypothetical protein